MPCSLFHCEQTEMKTEPAFGLRSLEAKEEEERKEINNSRIKGAVAP